MLMKKKKILWNTDFCKSKTGFGRHSKGILKYLYNTGKYDIVEYAMGLSVDAPILKSVPWKCEGSWPSEETLQKEFANTNPHEAESKRRAIGYGAYYIDDMIKKHKPDVFFGIQDIWAFNGYFERPWWNKINCIVHTTLDSLPILPDAIKVANKIKHYYVWAKFAETEMKRLGHNHVKTLHGSIETDKFFRLGDYERKQLRKKHNIPENAFIIGFVFRNQLRKSVVNLLEGFKEFTRQNPDSNAYLLLHTHWSEGSGWNIPMRIRELGIDHKRVLTTFVCKNCREFEVKPFKLPESEWKNISINTSLGQNQDCRFCGSKGSQITCNTQIGIDEEQLNQVYNLMDVYCHCFTSGGQEIPIQEAKLTELITLVTDYSCGEEYCTLESGGLPLSWQPYREPGTEFIKATTSVHSVAKQIDKVWRMKIEKRKEIGKIARKFVIDNCSVEVIGKQIEDILDSLPEVDYNFEFEEKRKNPDYPIQDIEDDKTWLKDMYKNILMRDVTDDDDGLLYWLKILQDARKQKN